METLEQLLEREDQLLYQINSTTYWAGAVFCTSQMEELKKVREQIRRRRGNKA